MARKRAKAKTPRRRKSKAINLLNLGESLLVGNLITEGLFKMNMYDFFMAGTAFSNEVWTGQGESKISFRELISLPASATSGSGITSSRFDVIKDNLKTSIVPMVGGLVGIRIGSKVLRKQLRPMIKQSNDVIKMAGFGDMVKV